MFNSVQLTSYWVTIPNKLQVLTKYFTCLNLTQPKPNLIKTLSFVHTFFNFITSSFRFECIYKNSSVINSFYSRQQVFSSYGIWIWLVQFFDSFLLVSLTRTNLNVYYTILVLNIVFCHSAKCCSVDCRRTLSSSLQIARMPFLFCSFLPKVLSNIFQNQGENFKSSPNITPQCQQLTRMKPTAFFSSQ